MNKDIQISELEQTIMDALEDYREDAERAIAETLPRVGKETAEELQSISPKKTGAYARGWKYQMDTRKNHERKLTVFNKTHYRLTHLLEKGYAKVNGGRVEGKPHISVAQKHAEEKAIERIESKLEQIK